MACRQTKQLTNRIIFTYWVFFWRIQNMPPLTRITIEIFSTQILKQPGSLMYSTNHCIRITEKLIGSIFLGHIPDVQNQNFKARAWESKFLIIHILQVIILTRTEAWEPMIRMQRWKNVIDSPTSYLWVQSPDWFYPKAFNPWEVI